MGGGGGEGKKKKPRTWPFQELAMKFMMVIDLKCFTLKDIFDMSLTVHKLEKAETWIFK